MMKRVFTEWRMAVQFLTRLPIPSSNTEFDEDSFVRSVQWYPYVGLLIGTLLVGVYWLVNLKFPPLVSGVVVVITGILLTGGLHLDGLMDTADGLLSGRDRERKLEIMKDSRVGAMGILVFVCLFALKWALLTELPPGFAWILAVMPAMGRIAMVWAIASFPPARKEGMGIVLATKVKGPHLLVASLPGLIPLLIAKFHGFLLLLIISCLIWILMKRISNSLGGLTGDTYGAICEVQEVLFLLVSFVVLNNA